MTRSARRGPTRKGNGGTVRGLQQRQAELSAEALLSQIPWDTAPQATASRSASHFLAQIAD